MPINYWTFALEKIGSIDKYKKIDSMEISFILYMDSPNSKVGILLESMDLPDIFRIYTPRPTILVLHKIRTSRALNYQQNSQVQVNIFGPGQRHCCIVYILY